MISISGRKAITKPTETLSRGIYQIPRIIQACKWHILIGLNEMHTPIKFGALIEWQNMEVWVLEFGNLGKNVTFYGYNVDLV